jgi:hypothetical protein
MSNNVVASGYLSNIKVISSSRGEIVKAWMTQRNEQGRCTFTMPVIMYVAGSSDERKAFLLGLEAARPEDSKYTALVEVSGELSTYFDTRQGVKMEERRAPQPQIAIDQIALVG